MEFQRKRKIAVIRSGISGLSLPSFCCIAYNSGIDNSFERYDLRRIPRDGPARPAEPVRFMIGMLMLKEI